MFFPPPPFALLTGQAVIARAQGRPEQWWWDCSCCFRPAESFIVIQWFSGYFPRAASGREPQVPWPCVSLPSWSPNGINPAELHTPPGSTRRDNVTAHCHTVVVANSTSHSTLAPPQCYLGSFRHLFASEALPRPSLPSQLYQGALHLTLLTKMLCPQKRRTLISSLWDGTNSAVSIWNILQGAIKDKRLEQLEKAMGLVTSAALTHLTVATAALKHTAELALYTRDTLRELIKTIIEARHQLAWDSVCVPKSNNI